MSHNDKRLLELEKELVDTAREGLKLRIDMQHLVEAFLKEAAAEKNIPSKTVMVNWITRIMEILMPNTESETKDGE